MTQQAAGPRRMHQPEADDGAAFREFSASQLYCARCRKAMPVREKLLLVLPSGNIYDYLCSGCGASVGTKKG